MPDCRPLIAPLRALLAQGAELAAGLAAERFAATSELSPSGSIGAHLRHVGDFVRCFLRDLAGGAIDYDLRERDARAEREPERARAELLGLAADLEPHGLGDPHRAVRVRAESCVLGADWQRSTVARELGMLLSHTVHHYALIAVLLRAQGGAPPAGFGVAPSTLAHWREERAACAPRAG